MLIQQPLLSERAGVDSFANYAADVNADVVAALQELEPGSSGFERSSWLYGRSGSGKSHLLNALANAWRARGVNVAVLRLQRNDSDEVKALEFILDNAASYSALLVDDANLFSGSGLIWEQSFYRLINCALGHDLPLIAAARLPADQLPWRLNDVRTRLRLLPARQLLSLSGARVLPVSQELAQRLGLRLSARVWRHIDLHYKRDIAQLSALLHALLYQQNVSGAPVGVSQVKKIAHSLALN